MNKDEMNDDAEFEAFLKGEGDLSHALQGMPQPSPSAALDAAILGRIRTSMEQQQGPAANDPGDAVPAPRLARGLGMRWRVPAGIAASALVGLFAVQAYQSDVSGDLVSAPAQERAADAILAQESAQAPAAPAPAVEVPNVAAPEASVDAAAKPPASEPAAATARPRAETGRAAAALRRKAAPEPAAPAPSFELAAPVPAAQPAPAPAAAAPAPVVAQAADREAAVKAAMEPKRDLFDEERRRAESKSVEQNFRYAPPAAPAPIASADVRDTPGPAKVAANASGGPVLTKEQMEKVTVTGSSIRRTFSPVPATPQSLWIERIEARLREGKDAEALREWTKFREAYPRYSVPVELEEKMKALAEQG